MRVIFENYLKIARVLGRVEFERISIVISSVHPVLLELSCYYSLIIWLRLRTRACQLALQCHLRIDGIDLLSANHNKVIFSNRITKSVIFSEWEGRKKRF